MTKDRFEELFDQILCGELVSSGFRRKGRNLLLSRGELQLGLLRAGGKLAGPGGICHILGLRHTCLRDSKELTLLVDPPTDPTDYPLWANPEALEFESSGEWGRYQGDRLGSKPYGLFFFFFWDERELVEHLEKLAYQINHRWLPWALTVEPEDISRQLEEFRDTWWIARIWLEDYATHVERPSRNNESSWPDDQVGRRDSIRDPADRN